MGDKSSVRSEKYVLYYSVLRVLECRVKENKNPSPSVARVSPDLPRINSLPNVRPHHFLLKINSLGKRFCERAEDFFWVFLNIGFA